MVSALSVFLEVGRGLFLAVAAFGADAVGVDGDATEGAAVYIVVGVEAHGGGVDSARKLDADNVELVFEQVVDNLNHALNGHCFFCHHHSAVGIGRGQLGLEGRALHGVLRMAVENALLFVDAKNGWQQRVVFTKHKGVVEILQHLPGRFSDFIAWENHIHTFIDGIFHFNGHNACVAVKVLCLTFKAIKAVGILKIKCSNASHER